MIVVVIFLLEKRRNIISVTFKRQKKCIEIAFEPLFGNCNTSIWILDCVHFLHWAGGIYAESREKKTADERTEYFKSFENILQFYFILFMFWLHLNPSSGFEAYSRSPLLILLCAHMKSVYGNGSWYVWLFACVLPFEYVHASNIFATSPLTAWCWKYEMERVYGVVMHKCAHKWFLFENVVGDAIFKVFQFYKVILSSVMLVIPAASLYDT